MSCAEDIAFEISNLREIEAEQRKVFKRVDFENSNISEANKERAKVLKDLREKERDLNLKYLSTEQENNKLDVKIKEINEKIEDYSQRKRGVERNIIKSLMMKKKLDERITEETKRYNEFLSSVRNHLFISSPSGLSYQETRKKIEEQHERIKSFRDEKVSVENEMTEIGSVLKEARKNLEDVLKEKRSWKKKVKSNRLRKDPKLAEIEEINREKEIDLRIALEKLSTESKGLRETKRKLIGVEKLTLNLKSMVKGDIIKFKSLQQILRKK